MSPPSPLHTLILNFPPPSDVTPSRPPSIPAPLCDETFADICFKRKELSDDALVVHALAKEEAMKIKAKSLILTFLVTASLKLRHSAT